MKALITLLLFVPIISFSQSKKELRAELIGKQAIIDSLKLQLVAKTGTIDTLTRSFVIAQQNYQRHIKITNDLNLEYNKCQQKVNELEQENTQLKSERPQAKATEKISKSNPDKTSTKSYKSPFENNPFAGSGSGNPI